MLGQSEAVFKEAIRLITEMDPQPEFLLIPGGLTKNGEEESHRKMAAYLEEIESMDVAVFVVPGHHDIQFFSHHRMKKVEVDSDGSFQADRSRARRINIFLILYSLKNY